MSRTALDGFPIGDAEKYFLLKIIKRFAGMYLSEILGFCIMGNHFHLLVKMLPESDFSDREIRKRFQRIYEEDRDLPNDRLPVFRKKLASLSELIRDIKVTFARYYNRRHHRRGYFWGERFKSVLVENGNTLINCLAYINLNPVRAGIVARPEDYRWNSLGYHVQTKNKDEFLSLDFGLKEFNVLAAKERFRRYRRFVYEKASKGHQIPEKTMNKERKREFTLSKINRFTHWTRYFTDSGIIGTREFVSKNYRRFKHLFMSKNEKKPKPINGLSGIYSFTRLSEVI